MYRWIVLISILGCLFSCNYNSEKQKNASTKTIDKGSDFYESLCKVCHGLDGKRGLQGAPDLTHSSLSLEEIQQIIRDGRGVMPPFKMHLDSLQIHDVAQYVLSMQISHP